MDMRIKPYIEVLEQPASKEFRFRYECERRSHGSIPGVNSTLSKKSYPKIKIVGLETDAHVIVSCVTKEAPYKVHPHRLISKEKGINHGVFITTAGPNNNEIELKNLGIQCVRKRDVKYSLEEREKVRVDPFEQGYDHGKHPSSIDLNVVRLCFQVFLLDRVTQKYTRKLTPIVTDPIYDKQTIATLSISKLSTEVASTAGGTLLMIFGTKVIKEDIKVRFFETQEDKVVWEASEDSLPRNNHDNQTTITVKTPTYRLDHTDDPVHVMVQLTKPSTGEAGKAIPFTFLSPRYLNRDTVNTPMDLSSKRKRPEFESSESVEPSPISTCEKLVAQNQPGSPKTNNSAAESITPERGTKSAENTPNVPHTRPEQFHYNRSMENGGVVMHLPKKPKYAEGPTYPIASRLPPHPAIYSPFLINPNVPPMMFNNLAYDCQCYPPIPPPYHPFIPFIPPSTPYMYQYPFYGSTFPGVKGGSQLSFNNQRDWHVQPEPILNPIVVKVSEKEIQPPISFDFNPKDQLNVSKNLMDLDLDGYISSLSDSFSNIKLNDKDSISLLCDNQQDVQLEPILEPIIVELSQQDMKSLFDYDYNTMKKHDQDLIDYNLLTSIKMENVEKSSYEGSSDDNVNKGDTEENLSLVCDNTIKEILKISRQQNCIKNNA